MIANKEQNIDQPNQIFIKSEVENDFVGFTDILLKLAEQLKIIVLIPFITFFLLLPMSTSFKTQNLLVQQQFYFLKKIHRI